MRALPLTARVSAALFLVLLVSGCGVKVLGKRIGLPARGAPSESGLQRELREAREAAALAPNEPYWSYRIARLYVGADSLAKAMPAIERALNLDPGYPPALSLRSSLDYRAGRHAQAARAIEAAIARPGAYPDGPPAELLEGLALHCEAMGESEKARAIVASMGSRARRAAPALVYLGLRGTEPEKAAAAAEAALQFESKSAANQNNWGIVRLRAGDPIAARKAFERAIEPDSTLAGPYYNLAILEKYYLFHDDAAARWFAAYWTRSQEDPDGLASVFGKSARPSLAQDGD